MEPDHDAADADHQAALVNFWQNQTAATLQDSVALTWPDGQRFSPIGFWAARGAGREFQLAFPRPKGSPEGGAISVEFHNPGVRVEGNSRIYARFQLKDLRYGGKVTY